MNEADKHSTPVAQSGQSGSQVLTALAASIQELPASGCVLVGVDGVDGSGKSVFANKLGDILRAEGRPTIRLSIDDFHRVRAIRYRRGQRSAEGFWLDSFDYERLRDYVLDPLSPGGSRRYRPRGHDLASDQILVPDPVFAPDGSIVVIDGLFLHRDELAHVWNFSIFLDVPFDVTARRMAARDGSNPDPGHPSMRRYVDAQMLYFAQCSPHRRASVVIDNTSFDRPRLIAPDDRADDVKD